MSEVGTDVYERRIIAFRKAGAVFGEDLAKALLLALSRGTGDRDSKVQLSAILLREILAAVEKLRGLGAPGVLVQAFERATRQACRDQLVRGMAHAMPSREAA